MPYVQLLLPPEVSDVAGAYMVSIPCGSVRPRDGLPVYWPSMKVLRVPSSAVHYDIKTRHFYLFTGQRSAVEVAAYQSGYYSDTAGEQVMVTNYSVVPTSSNSPITCYSPLGLLLDDASNLRPLVRDSDLKIINPAMMEELSGFFVGKSEETHFASPALVPYLRYLSAWHLRRRLGRALAACPVDLSFYMESKKTPDRFWQVTLPRLTDTSAGWSVIRAAGTSTTTSGNVSKPGAHRVTSKTYGTRLSMGNNVRTQIINKSKTYNFVQVSGLRKLELPLGHQMLKSLPTKKRSILRPKDLCKEE